MAYRQTAFAPGEWYHCYTRAVERGADTKNVFGNATDAKRFLEGLHLANSTEPRRRSDLYNPSDLEIFEESQNAPLVDIGAFCLMPNHFHLLLREVEEGGISRLMHTAGTAFSMYFNKKYGRIGNIFVKPFRAKYITDDRYFRRIVNYIHLNPAELYEPRWKEGKVKNIKSLENLLVNYPFSSLNAYENKENIYRVLLNEEVVLGAIENCTPFPRLLEEVRLYYEEFGSF